MRKLSGIIFIVIGLLILAGVLARTGLNHYWGNGRTGGGDYQKVEPLENIRDLEVKSTSGKVELIPTDNEKLSAALSGGTEKDHLVIDKSGGSMQVRVDRDGWWWPFSWFSHTKLTVHIPESYTESLTLSMTSGKGAFDGQDAMKLKTLVTRMTSGDLEVSNLNTDRLIIHGTSGQGDFENVTADKTKISMTSGDLDLSDFSGAFEGKMTSGDFTAEMKQVSGPVEFKMTSGDFDLELPEGAPLSLDIKATSGDINVTHAFDQVTEQSRKQFHGRSADSLYPVTIKATSGNIDIR